VVHARRGLFAHEPLPALGILRRDSDRTTARVTVVALPRRHADRPLVVGHPRDLLVAVEGHQGGVTDRDRIGSEREALRDVAAVADAARDDEVDLVLEPDVLERAASL